MYSSENPVEAELLQIDSRKQWLEPGQLEAEITQIEAKSENQIVKSEDDGETAVRSMAPSASKKRATARSRAPDQLWRNVAMRLPHKKHGGHVFSYILRRARFRPAPNCQGSSRFPKEQKEIQFHYIFWSGSPTGTGPHQAYSFMRLEEGS
jgi:hypothetical protein